MWNEAFVRGHLLIIKHNPGARCQLLNSPGILNIGSYIHSVISTQRSLKAIWDICLCLSSHGLCLSSKATTHDCNSSDSRTKNTNFQTLLNPRAVLAYITNRPQTINFRRRLSRDMHCRNSWKESWERQVFTGLLCYTITIWFIYPYGSLIFAKVSFPRISARIYGMTKTTEKTRQS